MAKIAACLILVGGAVAALSGQLVHCADCYRAKIWAIAPNEFERPVAKAADRTDFPETSQLLQERPDDIGLAFSGGGTRSATATMGELRGLHHNGWLPHVTYISAISGGSWGSLPFVFSNETEQALLGEFQPPGEVRLTSLNKPAGLLADAIATSGLTGSSIAEALDLAEPAIPVAMFNKLYDKVRQGLYGDDAEREDKTYTRMLEKVFIKKLVKESVKVPFFWNSAHLLETTKNEQNIALLKAGYFVPRRDRPFFIAGGAIIRPRDGFPEIIPVEYTPLYSGIRQQFGDGIGGSYVWSWAYDRPATELLNGHALVKPAQGSRFTLADVIASSGAAPQLSLYLGEVPGLPESIQKKASEFFPAFQQFSVQTRNRVPGFSYDRLGPSARYLHGDGGFVDYVGIMPLLARQVRNVIAFVNSDRDPEDETSLRSYFQKGGQNGGGDKTRNVVFKPELVDKVIADIKKSVAADGPPIACYSGWEVLPNGHYNIRGYEGLNICWVQNMRAKGWVAALRPSVKNELFPGKDDRVPKAAEAFVRFPQYRTFVEDKGRLMQLQPDQVNLLAHFTSWIVTDKSAVCAIHRAMKRPDGSRLLPIPKHLPTGTTCAAQ